MGTKKEEEWRGIKKLGCFREKGLKDRKRKWLWYEAGTHLQLFCLFACFYTGIDGT